MYNAVDVATEIAFSGNLFAYDAEDIEEKLYLHIYK
jgi:hypothetical protein